MPATALSIHAPASAGAAVLARAVIAAAIVGTIANAVAPEVRSGDPEALIPDFGVSKIVLCCAILGLVRLLQAARPAEMLPALVPAALGSLARSPDAAWLGLSVSMLLILLAADTAQRTRDGAAILLAVGVHAPVVSIAGLLLGGDLLALDAKLTAALLSLSGTPVSASAASLSVAGGMDLLLVWRCGVLGNLSVALMMWYVATRYVLGRVPARALPAALMVAAVMISVNVVRIAGMALDPGLYAWLHEGQGATLLRLGALACIAGIIGLNLRSLSA